MTPPGFYGKLPGLGDFVTRRLPADFVQTWDLWLRESLTASRAQLGNAWLDVYLTSPLWRFALTAGVVSQQPWVGVLMPSVDRVGRYFPFTLACPLASGTELLGLFCSSNWFERAETLALSALDDGLTIEHFDQQVKALGAPDVITAVNGDPMGGAGRANAWHLAARSPADIPAACPLLFGRAFEQLFCAYSLWWSSGSQPVKPSFLICQGLPPTEGFCALLDGDWSGKGWRDVDAMRSPLRSVGSTE